MSQDPHTSAAADPSWVDPAWAPPDDRDRPGDELHRSVSVVVGVSVLVLSLVVGLLWGFGAFGRRTDLLKDRAPGTVLETGPFELTFSEATAQRKKDFDDTYYWEVIMVGTGRTTADESIAPEYSGSSGMFVARDPNSSQTQDPESIKIGTGESFTGASTFTPGLPPTRFQVTFKFSADYRPARTIRFGVFILEFGNRTLTGQGEKGWKNSKYAYHLHLPVTVLPEESS
ncbi:hypothetical protein GCM10009841_04070 [Microlunatus panaciterrae]|uniref:Uncharacterized protein n=1 Tax=Microlunatus panaciterrae TaxID=400768 RepID=A0ABS2RLY2_9ACTN|nr:hypothetical protein [Microlunatus panaciterrae]MBM7798934.1 hypothetical protein [Microlunatus panaciterrae]